MTRKSESGPRLRAAFERIPTLALVVRKLQMGLPMGARALTLMTAIATTACVVPIPASFEGEEGDGDAGIRNDHPVILGAVPEDFPGPLALDPESGQEYTVTFADNDIDDILYVRVFRDYQKGAVGIIDQKTIQGGTLERTETFKTDNWCNAIGLPGTQIIIELVVSDRPFDEDFTKPPAYQATDGNKAKSHWMATCGVL